MRFAQGIIMSVNEPDKEHSQTYYTVFCALGGACFGAIPGAIIAWLGLQRAGLAVALLGMPVGVLLAFGYAAPGRLSKLLLAVLVVYNLPPVEEGAYEWVNKHGGPDEESINASDRLIQWMIAGLAPPINPGSFEMSGHVLVLCRLERSRSEYNS
jgi:hypothetical protein